MSLNVHLHVCFSCTDNSQVAAVAKRHLSAWPENDDDIECPEAHRFLEELAGRTGTNPGHNGGLSLWGIVGNYSDGARFADKLRPFWIDLLTSDTQGGPSSFERVMVFTHIEQRERSTAFEIFLESEALVIKEHELPFIMSW